eukprot:445515_1
MGMYALEHSNNDNIDNDTDMYGLEHMDNDNELQSQKRNSNHELEDSNNENNDDSNNENNDALEENSNDNNDINGTNECCIDNLEPLHIQRRIGGYDIIHKIKLEYWKCKICGEIWDFS